jgi:methylthioribose-1-phosphate isomerase
MVRTVEWRNGTVVMIDQRLLPTQEVYRVYRDYREVARAIRDMVVRGAPAIGVAAALGIALGMRHARGKPAAAFERICTTLAATRPIAANRALGRHGAALIPPRAQVLTHCNAGALATAGYGTALGVIRAAQEAGKQLSVLATETRPFLQGARLTAWELKKDHIPATLITDSMAGCFMRAGDVSCVVVGADRIAANGDVANKIGTYSLAVLAKRHGIPFFVAAPTSTIDLACPSGAKIPIENRDPREVTHIGDRQIAPSGVRVSNPAFDVTPRTLISAIITERGVARPPYATSLRRLVRGGRPAVRGRRAVRGADVRRKS